MRMATQSHMAAAFLVATTLAWAGEGRELLEAAKRGDLPAVRTLVNQGANVNTTQGDGATALHWAAHWDNAEMANILVAAGAHVNAADDDGVTPLSLACLNGGPGMVGKLLDAGADPNVARVTGETPLMTAAYSGDLPSVTLLLAHGARIDVKEQLRGQTPLMLAVAANHADIAALLIAKGADVRARSTRNFTALLFAAQQGNLEIARMLLAAGSDVNEDAPDGIGGDTKARRLYKPNTEASALLVAIDSGHEAMARFLLERGADPNQQGAGRTPLHSAVQEGMPDLVKALLERGANPNARLDKPMRLLSRILTALTGLDVSPLGATPFWLAADYGDTRIMRILADGGADPLLATRDRTTPLMAAAEVDYIEGQDKYGRRWYRDDTLPLQRAALDAVKIAVELGGDVNAVNAVGQTALHGAAYMGSNPLVQYLADHGAKLDVRNQRGQTPFFITQGLYVAGTFITRKETGDLLRSLGADTSLAGARGSDLLADKPAGESSKK